ncbi:Serine protease, subtilase family, partial [Candidatus Methanophagaceae archaeon]
RDKKLVDISTDAGSTWTLLKQLHSDMQGDISVSLDDYVGEEVMIRFCFDTVNAANNNHEGWFVDDVKLEADVLISTMSDLTITSKYEENVEGGFNVTYTIENIWGCDLGESNTGIYIDGEEVFVDSVPGLSAGASYTNTVGPFDCPCGSTVYVTVCADCNGAVVETDETNNCMENEWECPKPVIEVRKTVRDLKTGEWEDVILANVSDVVRFKIWVHNSGGCCNLTDIVVNDTLSECLEYAGNATHTPDGIENNADGTTTLYWCFTGPVGCCQDITTIEFDTYKTQPGKDRNCANVLAWCNEAEPHVQIFDADCALVHEKRDDKAIFESGTWYVDYGGNLGWDETFEFGIVACDVPVVGDINQDGLEDTAIFRSGTWYVDTTGDHIWDETFEFGIVACDVPVVGDINQDGRDDTAIFRSGTWYVDTTGDHIWDETFEFGLTPGDVPIVGDINPAGDESDEEPDIEVNRMVWDSMVGDWVNDIKANANDEVRFKIWIHNSGTCSLTNISVNDTLSASLEYATGKATVNGVPCEPEEISGQCLKWYYNAGRACTNPFLNLPSGEDITIEFNATKKNTGDDMNCVNVSAWYNETGSHVQVIDEDCAGVYGWLDDVAIFRSGTWYVDTDGAYLQGTGGWDKSFKFGASSGDVPVVGDINGDGRDDVAIFRSGTWYVDTQGNYINGTGGWDKSFKFGESPGDVPVVGDINGDGRDDVAIFRSGTWYVDITGDYQWDESFTFGSSPGDVPVVGDINRDGRDDVAIFRSGTWYVDTDGGYIGGTGGWDKSFTFGSSPGDVPIVGDIA